MATEKSTKKKKKSTEGSTAGSAVEKSKSSAGAQTKSPDEPQMRSALLPLIWLLIPFIAVVVYGLITRE